MSQLHATALPAHLSACRQGPGKSLSPSAGCWGLARE